MYKQYECDFNTVMNGIYKYKENVHTIVDLKNTHRNLDILKDGVQIEILYYRNISINDKNRISIEIKEAVKPFKSFDNYSSRLMSSMKRFAKNAKAQERKVSYDIVSTISKGYDASCCAAIAKTAGCDTAVTFCASGKYSKDSGREIATRLGYTNIIERDAMDYKQRNDHIEAYYVSTGELGSAISFSAFEHDFQNKLVFAGIRGDLIWGIESENRNNNFCFTNILSQLGYSERRLWVGYIHVPMPLFGASAWESIYDISNSDEMKPWSLKNDYDRPIPRRIVEESGVPRQLFGIDKHGAGFNYHYDWLRRIEKKMSEISAKSFKAYVKDNYRLRNLMEIPKWFLHTWKIYYNVIANKLGFHLMSTSNETFTILANPMASRYLIQWGSDMLVKKYKNILDKNGE